MPLDAWNELEEIEPALRASREVLLMRVEVCRALEKWEMMAEVSRFLADHDPGEAGHLLNLAYAVRRHAGIEEAARLLEKARERFPEDDLVAYNLACYRAVSGRIAEAKELLKVAFSLNPNLRQTALDDPDLQTLW